MLPKFKLTHLPDIERKRIAMPAAHTVRMRLNRLEYPEAWLRGQACDGIAQNIAATAQRYPDYPWFIDLLAEWVGQPAERIVLGAGIEEFIRALFMLSDGLHELVTPYPTCKMHEIYAKAFRVPVNWLPTHPGERAEIWRRRVMSSIHHGVGVLLLANPGQPVQNFITPGWMEEVAQKCLDNGVLLAIDEAYYGFGADTCMGLVDRFPNVLVLRTFSKAMGLAGARIGFAVGQRPLIGFLDGIRQSGEVSSASMALAAHAILNEPHNRWRIEDVIAGRERLVEEIDRAGDDLVAYADYGNSVLIDCHTSLDALGITEWLAARGILIRHVADLANGEFVMVTCGGESLMERFADEFLNGWAEREWTKSSKKTGPAD